MYSILQKDILARNHTSDPTKWGFKLQTLWYILERASPPVGKGLSKDFVVSPIGRRCLRSGYHVWLEDFFTSPKFFKDFACKFGARETNRESRRDSPSSAVNALIKT